MYRPMYEGALIDGKLQFRPPMRVWECRDETLPVGNDIFYNLQHNVTFADDQTINTALYERYQRWFCVYPDWQKMQDELREQILVYGDYWEKRYKTTLIEYNPINNYDMVETETDTRCGEARSAGNTQQNISGQSDESQYGYNEITPTATGRDRNASSSNTASNSTDKTRQHGERKLTRSGNIGVTTSSAMLREYRDVQIQILDEYLKSFENLFMIL